MTVTLLAALASLAVSAAPAAADGRPEGPRDLWRVSEELHHQSHELLERATRGRGARVHPAALRAMDRLAFQSGRFNETAHRFGFRDRRSARAFHETAESYLVVRDILERGRMDGRLRGPLRKVARALDDLGGLYGAPPGWTHRGRGGHGVGRHDAYGRGEHGTSRSHPHGSRNDREWDDDDDWDDDEWDDEDEWDDDDDEWDDDRDRRREDGPYGRRGRDGRGSGEYGRRGAEDVLADILARTPWGRVSAVRR